MALWINQNDAGSIGMSSLSQLSVSSSTTTPRSVGSSTAALIFSKNDCSGISSSSGVGGAGSIGEDVGWKW